MPNVRGDRVQLEALFSNLVDNAIKYMGEGELKEIHIGCQGGGDDPVYYVRDTGVGMTADQVPRAFLPFQRFHAEAGARRRHRPGPTSARSSSDTAGAFGASLSPESVRPSSSRWPASAAEPNRREPVAHNGALAPLQS